MNKVKKEIIQNLDLEKIFHECLDILIFVDIKSLKILAINDTVTQILGYQPDELIHKRFDVLFPKCNENKEELIEQIAVYGPVIECQKFLHKNGDIIPLDLTATIIEMNVGKVAFVTLRDSREKDKSNKQMQYTRNHLKLINQIIRHDIINDISIIKGALKLYMETKDNKYLEAIQKSVDNSIAIIKNMRKVEKQLEENKNFQIFNVYDVIQDVIKKYNDMNFTITGSANVLADETIKSVFSNIIHNAIVHGKTKKMIIKISKTSDKVIVDFIDFGKGISNEIKEKIFEKGFSKSKGVHMGLGLYIVKESLKNYNGEIEVKDNKPTGSIFTVYLQRVN